MVDAEAASGMDRPATTRAAVAKILVRFMFPTLVGVDVPGKSLKPRVPRPEAGAPGVGQPVCEMVPEVISPPSTVYVPVKYWVTPVAVSTAERSNDTVSPYSLISVSV